MTLDQAFRELRAHNERVPYPLRLPTVDEVNAAEKKLGVTFPPDYRRFLLEVSDVTFGALEPALTLPDEDYRSLVVVATEAWEEMEVPRTLLPFCEDNGDYYCFNAAGEVVYWSHNGTTDEKWANLAAWIEEVWLGEA